MTKWVFDKNGNRASIEFFGSEEKARASLETLDGCTNCTNCTNCYGCNNCNNCMHCRFCYSCDDCYNCIRCKYCVIIRSATDPLVVGIFRSDGYQFVLNNDGGVRAGCRVFDSMEEARKHWTRTRGGTPLGKETMAILDSLEALGEIRANQRH